MARYGPFSRLNDFFVQLHAQQRLEALCFQRLLLAETGLLSITISKAGSAKYPTSRVKLDFEVCQLFAAGNTFRNPLRLTPTTCPSLSFISWIAVLGLYLLPFPLR